MKTQFKFDNQKIYLPNASTLGFGLYHSKRGNWVQTANFTGRVLGRVTCEKKVYVYAVALLGAQDCLGVRWVEPKDILVCLETPPKEILLLIQGDWKHPEDVVKLLSDHIVDIRI